MLLEQPLAMVAATIASFAAGHYVYHRSGKLPVLQPVLVAILAVIALLLVTGVRYDSYFEGTQMLHALLGPAIVALAVPLFENLRKARQALLPILCTVLLGGAAVTLAGVGLGILTGLDPVVQRSLLTKSISAPIALSVAAQIGGAVPFTILSVFITGIFGVIVTPSILRLIEIRDPRVIGLTLGLTSHAFGIARALEFGSEAVAFATLGMVLMGCAISVVVPIAIRLT